MKKEVEIIPITNDVMFKALFTQNPDLLKDFLESTLNLPSNTIKSLKFLNFEKIPIYYCGKLATLDVLVEAEERTINVEIQIAKKEEIKNGLKVIYSLSEDEKIREYVRQREKAEMDYRSDMSYAKAEGKAERDSELIAKWKAKGMTDEEIAELLAD